MLGKATITLLTTAAFVLAACGGGGGNPAGTPAPGTPTTPTTPTQTPTSLYAVPAPEALTAAEVATILSQAVGEAQARNLPSVISVVDRVGNVLAVYQMTGAPATFRIPPPPGGGPSFDAQGLTGLPAAAGAISKAITAAYLSSSGNAFTTRTASDIVQEHFPLAPNTIGLESGPLFGVQFSSLPCSDLNRRLTDGTIGPKRAPLGLAGDPGSVPLYKNGVVVGGIGVMGDGVYGVDNNAANDDDNDPEEYIALAGSRGFEAPVAIQADRVSIDGTLLSFIDAKASQLRGNGATPALSGAGVYTPIGGFYPGPGPIAGTPYATPASGYRLVTAAERSAGTAIDNPDALLLVDAAGNNRFPIRAGTDNAEVAQPLTAAEVKAIAEEAFKIMSRARGAIRQPLDSRMQATISIVDTRGQVLAIQRAPDAPVFGTDVSLQKARSAAFLSNPKAASDLLGSGNADVAGFVQKLRDFVGNQSALTGGVAYAERPIGLLARPYFPDGQVGTANGPLSRPIASFSPFSTGLQSALIAGNLVQVVGEALGTGPAVPSRCTTLPAIDASGINRLQNGLQIFPGGEPIYRGTTLVGAIGVSGDGIDQDDMVSFLGVFNGGVRVGTVGHAARDMRISAIPFRQANNGFLPYVQCPIAPFLDTPEQNVCEGK
ncbi:heme-binding protein [Sphingomonas profundi]|uniref:heme-binding protein n=1 Tax=Alterirhizorhabdus profundi TaxID=2681549 RepID=UPI0012E8363F|nr:heme-binding protein [Sphingomonas profundi]